MKKTVKILALLLCLALLGCFFASCAGEGRVVMTYADKSMSANTFEFLLTRMKGTLEGYGYNVNSESLWNTVISADGTTYGDYFRVSVLEQASRYLIADYLFDRNGLVLADDRIAIVDELMAKYVKQAGSKTNLNAELKNYGVNYDMLREIYLLETRIDMLKDHLFGEKGEKTTVEQREKYLKENYVAFGQIFLAGYYEVIDKDKYGDSVYYTDEKHTAIAYDKVNGHTVVNEFGKEEKDILGNPVYYNADGKIAYDTKNGVLGYAKDDKGNKIIEHYDSDTLAELEAAAGSYADACDGDMDLFLEHAELYDQSESLGKTMYLSSSEGYYSMMSESVSYLDSITKTLAKMEVGECRVVESDYGFHVICKYETEEGIYDDEKQKDVFADFYQSLVAELFEDECRKYEASVEIITEALDKAPKMSEVASNQVY